MGWDQGTGTNEGAGWCHYHGVGAVCTEDDRVSSSCGSGVAASTDYREFTYVCPTRNFHGIVFDVFSSKFVDYEKPKNLYIAPSSLLDKIYTLSNNLIIYNNYNPYQLMVVLYKEKLNGWRGIEDPINETMC